MPVGRSVGGGQAFERSSEIIADEWVLGIICDVRYNPSHTTTFKGEQKTFPAIQFRFKHDGYDEEHFTRWMADSMDERSSLFRFVNGVCDSQVPPFSCIDVDRLIGCRVKTMWLSKHSKVSGRVYQVFDRIKAVGDVPNIIVEPVDELNRNHSDEALEEPPF